MNGEIHVEIINGIDIQVISRTAQKNAAKKVKMETIENLRSKNAMLEFRGKFSHQVREVGEAT